MSLLSLESNHLYRDLNEITQDWKKIQASYSEIDQYYNKTTKIVSPLHISVIPVSSEELIKKIDEIQKMLIKFYILKTEIINHPSHHLDTDSQHFLTRIGPEMSVFEKRIPVILKDIRKWVNYMVLTREEFRPKKIAEDDQVKNASCSSLKTSEKERKRPELSKLHIPPHQPIKSSHAEINTKPRKKKSSQAEINTKPRKIVTFRTPENRLVNIHY